LNRERRLQELLHRAAGEIVLASAHDCSEGGLAVALAESAILGGEGFAVSVQGDLPEHVTLFSESAARAVVSVRPEDEERLEELAADHEVPLARIGETGGPRVVVEGMFEATVHELREIWELAIPRLLGEVTSSSR
jgi:phosphoribosylformylglycinamidine synthase